MVPQALMRPWSQARHRGLEVIAADVVEVDVDAVGRRLFQLRLDVAVLVVERGVEAERVREQLPLLRWPRAADDPRAPQLRELARDVAPRRRPRPTRTRGRRPSRPRGSGPPTRSGPSRRARRDRRSPGATDGSTAVTVDASATNASRQPKHDTTRWPATMSVRATRALRRWRRRRARLRSPTAARMTCPRPLALAHTGVHGHEQVPAWRPGPGPRAEGRRRRPRSHWPWENLRGRAASSHLSAAHDGPCRVRAARDAAHLVPTSSMGVERFAGRVPDRRTRVLCGRAPPSSAWRAVGPAPSWMVRRPRRVLVARSRACRSTP